MLSKYKTVFPNETNTLITMLIFSLYVVLSCSLQYICIDIYWYVNINGVCVCVYTCFTFVRKYSKKHNLGQVSEPANWVSINHIFFKANYWPLEAKVLPSFVFRPNSKEFHWRWDGLKWPSLMEHRILSLFIRNHCC